MKDIIVVSLSPALDKNYRVTQLNPGQMHRCNNPLRSPGGKGVNVARVLSLLGAKVKLLGFFAGDNGQYIINNLLDHGIGVEAVNVCGETRTSINILDSSTGSETEILEAGPVITPEQNKLMEEKFRELLADAGSSPVVVFSGGIPAGIHADIYKKLIDMAKPNSICFLDTSQEALIRGLSAYPYFIKPNPRELSQIFSDNELPLLYMDDPELFLSQEDIRPLYNKSKQLNIPKVALTLSAKGALLCLEDRALYAKPLPITPLNTIGCGDSFTAGFAFATANSFSDSDCLRYAVASASSNALFEQVGFINKNQVIEFLKLVIIDEYIYNE